jgi:hypothetical protein
MRFGSGGVSGIINASVTSRFSRSGERMAKDVFAATNGLVAC